MIVLGLFLNRWSTTVGMRKFKELTRLAFRQRLSCSIPIFTQLVNTFMALVTDSRYSTSNLERTLIQAFSVPPTIFHNSNSNIKIAVTATTTDDSETCIFSNYNGAVKRPADCGKAIFPSHYREMQEADCRQGYRLVREIRPSNELQAWEA